MPLNFTAVNPLNLTALNALKLYSCKCLNFISISKRDQTEDKMFSLNFDPKMFYLRFQIAELQKQLRAKDDIIQKMRKKMVEKL